MIQLNILIYDIYYRLLLLLRYDSMPVSIVDILLRKENYIIFLILLLSINELIILFINISNILDNIGNNKNNSNIKELLYFL